MNEIHLYCPARQKHKRYCKYGDTAGTAEPNILQRDFTAAAPFRKWSTDITEFKAFGKRLYLSVILDMYNGEIIHYALTESASLASVQELLTTAHKLLPSNSNLLFHSDRGWQYQQRCIKSILAAHGIIQSMSRRGECYDNAIIETFFASLKNELFYVEKFESIEHLASEIHEYIRYYNNDRIRAKLNFMSPVQFRLLHYPVWKKSNFLGTNQSGFPACYERATDEERASGGGGRFAAPAALFWKTECVSSKVDYPTFLILLRHWF